MHTQQISSEFLAMCGDNLFTGQFTMHGEQLAKHGEPFFPAMCKGQLSSEFLAEAM